jgi:hypothetical protein
MMKKVEGGGGLGERKNVSAKARTKRKARGRSEHEGLEARINIGQRPPMVDISDYSTALGADSSGVLTEGISYRTC